MRMLSRRGERAGGAHEYSSPASISEDSMKRRSNRVILYPGYMLLVFSAFVLINGCVSSRIVSYGFGDKNRPQQPVEMFYLKHVIVTAFNFYEDEEIGYIMDKKMNLALRCVDGITLKKSAGRRVYSIEPELIVKTYEEKYRVRSYYLLSVRVLFDERIVYQFSYEYNGPASIFDGRVQSALIGKFIRDIKTLTS